MLQLNLKELMAYVSGEILKNFFRLHFDKKLLTDKWNLCWPVMHTTGKRIIQKGKMLIVVNWQIATPIYVKSKNFVNAHFMGNGFSQLTYYIGPFLNGCFETVKITKTKKCWKVEFEGHLKSNLKSFLKINHQNICFNWIWKNWWLR